MAQTKFTQSQFLIDLQTFIQNHSHYLLNEGTAKHSLANDTMSWTINDVDGDYERIEIKLNLIS